MVTGERFNSISHLVGAVLAVAGIAQEIWLARGARVMSLVIYVLLGWLAQVAVAPLWQALAPACFAWPATGGTLYTLGIASTPPTTSCVMATASGTLVVLGGSLCHFFTLLLYVA